MEDKRQSFPTSPDTKELCTSMPFPVSMYKNTRHYSATGLPTVSIKQSPTSSVSSSPTTSENSTSPITIEGKLENIHCPNDIQIPPSISWNPMGHGCHPHPSPGFPQAHIPEQNTHRSAIIPTLSEMRNSRMVKSNRPPSTNSDTQEKYNLFNISPPDLVSSSSPNPREIEKRRGLRTMYTNEQILLLERLFEDEPYPDQDTVGRLSRNLGCPEKVIKIWFQNRRARTRKYGPLVKNYTRGCPMPRILSAPVSSTSPEPLTSIPTVNISEPKTHESDLDNLHVSFPVRSNVPSKPVIKSEPMAHESVLDNLHVSFPVRSNVPSKPVIKSEPMAHESDLDNLHVSFPVRSNVPSIIDSPEPLTSKPVIKSELMTHESDLDNVQVSFQVCITAPPTIELDSRNSSNISSTFTSDLENSPNSITYHKASPPSSPNDTERQRRNSRTNYSHKQIKILEKMYVDKQYPDNDTVDRISSILGLPQKHIKIWFQNKRARCKKGERVRSDTSRIRTSPVASQVDPSSMPPNGMMLPNGMMPPHAMMPPHSMMTPYGMMPPAAMMMPQPNPYYPGYMPYPYHPYPFMYPNC